MTVHLRNTRVPFRFSGPDASKLLNDVMTGTFEADPAKPHWSALLTPQGKIIGEGLSGWAEDGFWFDVDRDAVEAFTKRMRLYRMRADVDISDMSETHVVGWTAEVPSGLAHLDPRGAGLGWRIIAPKGDAAAWSDDATPWHLARIAACVPELGSDLPLETYFPHDIGMDLLGGIDFQKGCYIGQEVVSRMKHRGTARRRPVRVAGDGLTADAAIMAGEREAGNAGFVVNGEAVAIVRLDRIADPATVTVNGQPATLALPSWASYRFGDSGGGDSD